MRVLVVEDFAPLANSMVQGLRENGYAVDLAMDGEEGLATALSAPYDAIVLDVMLPKIDGFTLLKRLRQEKVVAAILILTARDTVADMIQGLDLGADDYLTKPFAFAELLARLRAVIRRAHKATDNIIHVGDLLVDTTNRKASRAGRALVLSAREYSLLEYLAVRRGNVVTRTEIWDHVYDFASEPGSNVIDVYVGYLRKKLDQDFKKKLIHTRRGQGYVLEDTP